MDKNNPIGDLMQESMAKLRELADTNSIIGQPIHTPDGVTLQGDPYQTPRPQRHAHIGDRIRLPDGKVQKEPDILVLDPDGPLQKRQSAVQRGLQLSANKGLVEC